MIYCVASNPKVAAHLADLVRSEKTPTEPTNLRCVRAMLPNDGNAMLLLWCVDAIEAARAVRALRTSGVSTKLLCLINEGDAPTQRVVKGRVEVLGAGADDCQPFPIDKRELLARLDALQRRGVTALDHIVPIRGEVRFNTQTGRLYSPRGSVQFTRIEAKCLIALIERPGSVLSGKALYDRMYDGRGEAARKIVDVVICKVRRKLSSLLPGETPIVTVWGMGFRFELRPEVAA